MGIHGNSMAKLFAYWHDVVLVRFDIVPLPAWVEMQFISIYRSLPVPPAKQFRY